MDNRTLYSQIKGSGPTNIPSQFYSGSNENLILPKQEKPLAHLFSTGFIHALKNNGLQEKAEATLLNEHSGFSVPCFLDTEEFLAKHDPQEAERLFG